MQTLLYSCLIFAPLAFAAVEPWAYAPLQIFAFCSAAALFASGRAANPNSLYKNLLPAVLAIALLGLLQAVTEVPVNAHPGVLFTAWRPATLNAVVMWLFYAALLFVVPQLLTTPERFKKLMWVIFGMGVFVALMGMLQKSGDETIVYGLRKVRGQPFGPFVNRDHGAYFLAMSAMAGLGLFFSGFRELFAHQSRTRLFDLLAVQFLKLVMVCALVYGIVRTGSRGGLHSFAFAAAVTGFFSAGFIKTKKFKVAAWAGLAALLAGYCLLLWHYKILLGLKDDAFVNSVTERFSMYKSALAMLKDFPFFGSGLGAVEHAFPPYKLSGVPLDGLVRHVHSDWLELFVQTGLVGGFLYFAGLLAALWRFFTVWRNCRSFRLKAFYGGALGAVLAASAHNFVEFASQMPANSLVFYTLLGALASKPPTETRRSSLDDEEPPAPVPAKKIFAVPAIAAAVLLSLSTIPPVLGWWYNWRAETAPYNEKVVCQAAALKWHPDPQYAFRLGNAFYNQAIKERPANPALLEKARQAILPYLKRVPLNYDLGRLNAAIFYQQTLPQHLLFPKPAPPKHRR